MVDLKSVKSEGRCAVGGAVGGGYILCRVAPGRLITLAVTPAPRATRLVGLSA